MTRDWALSLRIRNAHAYMAIESLRLRAFFRETPVRADESCAITVRDIDPGDKSWHKREARQIGVSMEELVRRLIREKRTKTERRRNPPRAFARHFGEAHGIELPEPVRRGYKPPSFTGEEGE